MKKTLVSSLIRNLIHYVSLVNATSTRSSQLTLFVYIISNSRLTICHQTMALLSVTRNICLLTGYKLYSRSQ